MVSCVLFSALCSLGRHTHTHTHTAPKMAEVTGVNSVARNNGGNVLAVALDFGVIALYRFPCPYVGTKNKRYAGHSAGVSKVCMHTHTHTHTHTYMCGHTHAHTYMCPCMCSSHVCLRVSTGVLYKGRQIPHFNRRPRPLHNAMGTHF